MTSALLITILVIVMAVIFDFINGFHDAANSIATIVATKVLTPREAVIWAAFFNFAALFFFGSGVAKMVGGGMIDLSTVTPWVLLAGLGAAVAWGLITWWFGLPTSSSHALLGGYAGAAVGHAFYLGGIDKALTPLIGAAWVPILAFIVAAPMMGGALAFGLARLVQTVKRCYPAASRPKFLAGLQLVSSALLSLMHGANDAQKTAGIIGGVLVAAGYQKAFGVPDWALGLSYLMLSLGTLTGGWRIVRTVGERLTHLDVSGGFAAETGAALSILTATLMRLPVSTTHAVTGAVVGVGCAHGVKAVHWDVATRIFRAWCLTIPAAALLGGGIDWLMELAQH